MDQLMRAPWPGNVRQLRNVLERLVVNSRRDVITVADLPREVLSMTSTGERALDASSAANMHRELFKRMVHGGESFWSAVYEPFMMRDITRADVRAIVREGLIYTRGYKALAALFNVPGDHRRLLTFLRKHDCHLPEQELHCVAAALEAQRGRAVAE
jgi:DNA-binding NtrC family response regulator